MLRRSPSSRRLGLRARITLTFTLGAFALSLLLASTAYLLTRAALIRQRDSGAVRQTYRNARLVQDDLRADPPSAGAVLRRVQGAGQSQPLLFWRGEWAALTAEYGPTSLPDDLRARVGDESAAARMVYDLNDDPVIAVGVPLTGVAASYYEITNVADLDSTLTSVRVSLAGGAALTTALGVVLGSFAARRAVRPLASAARAAEAIAGGRLDTRLEPTDDRDLGLLTNAFNDMAAALEQRIAADARFASDVSHELRSPLMTLAASVEVLQARRDELSDRSRAAVDLLTADVTRFQKLVEDLLEISRVDSGGVGLHTEEVVASEFVRQAVSVSSGRDAPVHVGPDAEVLVIDIDKRRMARAIANLVDNARIHGGGDIAVEVLVPPGEGEPVGHVWVTVSDRGPGVPDAERERIFKRFSRGASAGRRAGSEGVGLGLSLVEEHVRLHGGRVWVEDRADGEPGARFVIELPAEAL